MGPGAGISAGDTIEGGDGGSREGAARCVEFTCCYGRGHTCPTVSSMWGL